MIFKSKKIDYFHEIRLNINGNKYIVNTNLDVCAGDMCKFRIAGKVYETKILTAKRLDNEAIIDPRLIEINFDVDISTFDYYIEDINYYYKVKLLDYNHQNEYKIFASNALFEVSNLVMSSNHFGIIEEVLYDVDEFVEDKVLEAYSVSFNNIRLKYSCALVPRYLLNNLKSTFIVNKKQQFDDGEIYNGLFDQLVISSDCCYQYQNTPALNYIVNKAKLNDEKCMVILKYLAERNDKNEELDFWSSKIEANKE